MSGGNSFFFMLCSITTPLKWPRYVALVWMLFLLDTEHLLCVCEVLPCAISATHFACLSFHLSVSFCVCFNKWQFLDFAKAFSQDTVSIQKFFFYSFSSDLLWGFLDVFFANYRGWCFLYDKSDQIEASPGQIMGNNSGECGRAMMWGRHWRPGWGKVWNAGR